MRLRMWHAVRLLHRRRPADQAFVQVACARALSVCEECDRPRRIVQSFRGSAGLRRPALNVACLRSTVFCLMRSPWG